MKPTVVTLSAEPEGASSVTFEQIMEGHSELRGRGRKRRKKRKLERVENRGEVRSARRKNKQSAAEDRILRRKTRKTGRVEKKAIGQEEEEEQTQNPASEDQGSQNTTDQPQGAADQGNGEGESQTTENSDIRAAEQDAAQDSGENEGGDDQSEDEVDSEQGESDEASGFTGESGVDGTIEMSPEDAQWNEYFSSAEGKAKIHPKVKLLARRIEQNKHYIKKLEKQLARGERHNGKLQADILRRKSILAKLESKLAGYSKFEGDYSEARGGRKEVARKKAEVRAAKHEARQERKAVIKTERKAKRSAKQGNGVTEVEQGLNADIKDNEIEVPAEEVSGFNGTGLIGLDEQFDIDAPVTRKFDLKFSAADGSKSAINIKQVAIGLGIGVAAILIIKAVTKKK